MGQEYNIYNIDDCKRAVEALESFPTTCRIKAQHGSKVFELRKLLDEYCMPLNCILFNDDNFEYFNYYQGAVTLYNSTTKAELDRRLRRAVKSIIKEIQECVKVEHQTKTGELVLHPTHKGLWIDSKRIQK